MRLVGTGVVCVLAAFGAAFLIGRATVHPTRAGAATPPAFRRAATSSAGAPSRAVEVSTQTGAKLAAEFAPQPTALRPVRVVHRAARKQPHKAAHPKKLAPPATSVGSSSAPAPSPASTSSGSSAAAPQPSVTPSQPTFSSPGAVVAPVSPAPAPSTGGSRGSGSGTTSIGGSRRHSGGSGTTSVG